MLKKLINIILFVVSANVFAGGFSNPTNLGSVELLVPNMIRVDAKAGQVFADPDGCSGQMTTTMLLLVLDPNNKELAARQTSFLLTALTSGNKVQIYLSGCTLKPWIPLDKALKTNGDYTPTIQNIGIIAS